MVHTTLTLHPLSKRVYYDDPLHAPGDEQERQPNHGPVSGMCGVALTGDLDKHECPPVTAVGFIDHSVIQLGY